MLSLGPQELLPCWLSHHLSVSSLLLALYSAWQGWHSSRSRPPPLLTCFSLFRPFSHFSGFIFDPCRPTTPTLELHTVECALLSGGHRSGICNCHSAVSQAPKVQNPAHGVLPAPSKPASPQTVASVVQWVSLTTPLVADSRHGGGEGTICNTSSPFALHNGAITKSYGFYQNFFLKKYLNISLATPGLGCSMWDLVP